MDLYFQPDWNTNQPKICCIKKILWISKDLFPGSVTQGSFVKIWNLSSIWLNGLKSVFIVLHECHMCTAEKHKEGKEQGDGKKYCPNNAHVRDHGIFSHSCKYIIFWLYSPCISCRKCTYMDWNAESPITKYINEKVCVYLHLGVCLCVLQHHIHSHSSWTELFNIFLFSFFFTHTIICHSLNKVYINSLGHTHFHMHTDIQCTHWLPAWGRRVARASCWRWCHHKWTMRRPAYKHRKWCPDHRPARTPTLSQQLKLYSHYK